MVAFEAAQALKSCQRKRCAKEEHAAVAALSKADSKVKGKQKLRECSLSKCADEVREVRTLRPRACKLACGEDEECISFLRHKMGDIFSSVNL